MSRKLDRWRGLAALVRDAVDGGSHAIERVQKETAARPFAVLEALPLGALAAGIHRLHDLAISGTHGMIRLGNRALGAAVELSFAVAERAGQSGATAPQPERQQHERDGEAGGGRRGGGNGTAA